MKKDDFFIEIYLQKMYIGWVGVLRDAQAEIDEDLKQRQDEMRKKTEGRWVPLVVPKVEGMEMPPPDEEFPEAAIQRLEADLVESRKRDDFLRNLEEDLAFEYETIADEQSDYCRKTSLVPPRRFPQTSEVRMGAGSYKPYPARQI